ncbi:hypothetical protein ACP0HM_05235 [Escherichia coli]
MLATLAIFLTIFFIIDKYTADDKVVFDEVDPSLVEAMKEPEQKEEPITVTVTVVEEAKPHTVPVEIVVVPEVKVESPVANIFSNEAEHRSPAHDTDSFLRSYWLPSDHLL